MTNHAEHFGQLSMAAQWDYGQKLFRKHFFKMLPYSALIGLIEVVTQLHIAGLIIHQLILDSVLSAGFFYFFLAVEKGHASEFKFSDFFKGFSRIFDLFILAVLLNIRIFFGFILLIIPAFYLMNIYSQSFNLLLENKGDAFEVLKLSKELVRPHFWKVMFGTSLPMIFTIPELFAGPDTMAASPFFFLWSAITSPLAAALSFALYRQIVPRQSTNHHHL